MILKSCNIMFDCSKQHGMKDNIRQIVQSIICALFTVMLWFAPLISIPHSNRGIVMNYFSVAFVLWVSINSLTFGINLFGKLVLIFDKADKPAYKWCLYILTLFGGAPANVLCAIVYFLLTQKINFDFINALTKLSYVHIILAMMGYNCIYAYA